MIEQNAHRWSLRVYFEDTDAGGIVYHASFLRFAERGRTEALRELQATHQEMVDQLGLFFVVRRIKVDYLTPARLDESLWVVTRVLRLGGAAVELEQRIEAADGTARAELAVLLVCLDMAAMRPAKIPGRWRAAMAGLQAAAVPADAAAGRR